MQISSQLLVEGYTLLECSVSSCGLRLSLVGSIDGVACPYCTQPLNVISRYCPVATSQPHSQKKAFENQFCVLLDNIRSIYNVGSIFRTADGVRIDKLYLGGITATPEHPKIKKTALGAEQLSWEKIKNSLGLVKQLKKEGHTIIGLETTVSARSIFQAVLKNPKNNLLLIIGNEQTGIDPEILALCDQIIYIPMIGNKLSLNVAIAAGIGMYHFGNQLKRLHG